MNSKAPGFAGGWLLGVVLRIIRGKIASDLAWQYHMLSGFSCTISDYLVLIDKEK